MFRLRFKKPIGISAKEIRVILMEFFENINSNTFYKSLEKGLYVSINKKLLYEGYVDVDIYNKEIYEILKKNECLKDLLLLYLLYGEEKNDFGLGRSKT
ncbi:MAG: hypothetical protein NC925_05245 [Candidatus Omnitrophica bacterium]|nr:hypothetical protein [Candidatus Omnitrophota bacterium]